MGWDNPPIPWRELARRLSWGMAGRPPGGGSEPDRPRPVTRLPVPGRTGPGNPGGDSTPASPRNPAGGRAWAELHCHSSYSFLDGASAPAELVAEAARLGLAALAITDHDGMYGVPQFAQAAARLREQGGPGIGTIFGAELSLGLPPGCGGAARSRPRGAAAASPAAGPPARSAARSPAAPAAGPEGWPSATPRTGVPDPGGRHLLVLARDPEGYRRLCQVISAAQLAGGEKGRPVYDLESLAQAHGGHWVILTGCRKGAVPAALASADPGAAEAELAALADMFGRQNVVVELTSHDQPTDDERNDALYELATSTGTAVIATGNVHYTTPRDARLAQALAAVRARSSLDEMDGWLAASGAAYLRSGAEMAGRLRGYPGVAERTMELARTARS